MLFVTQSIRFSNGFTLGFFSFFFSSEIRSLSLPEKIVCENIYFLLKALLTHLYALLLSCSGLTQVSSHTALAFLFQICRLILALIWTKVARLKKEKLPLALFHFN